MLLVAPVQKERQIPMTEAADRLWGIDKLNVPRSDIPAVTHIDYSARVQTVSRETNPDYYDLIREFERLTGCAVVVNTSFNVRGEPIVCTPADAYRCFMRTHIDYLVLGPFLLEKAAQPEWKESGELATGVPARLTPAEGRKFGLLVGGAFLVLAAIFWRRLPLHRWPGSPACLGGGLVVGRCCSRPGRLGPV